MIVYFFKNILARICPVSGLPLFKNQNGDILENVKTSNVLVWSVH